MSKVGSGEMHFHKSKELSSLFNDRSHGVVIRPDKYFLASMESRGTRSDADRACQRMCASHQGDQDLVALNATVAMQLLRLIRLNLGP